VWHVLWVRVLTGNKLYVLLRSKGYIDRTSNSTVEYHEGGNGWAPIMVRAAMAVV
jgi:hypothetical protein